MTLEQLTNWATAQFVAVGGEHWQEQLRLGGIAALTVIVLLALLAVLFAGSQR